MYPHVHSFQLESLGGCLPAQPGCATMWKQIQRPAWQKEQTARLETGRKDSRREAFRSGAVAEDEKEEGRTYLSGRTEPTAASSSSTTASQHARPEMSLPPSSIAADLSKFRDLTMTPASFQPHRHVWFVCGRPVMVPLVSI